MPVAIQVILWSALAVYVVTGFVVRQRARRRGGWRTVRRLQFLSLGFLMLFFGYRIVTGDVATRLFGGVAVLVIVALIAALRDEKPRV